MAGKKKLKLTAEQLDLLASMTPLQRKFAIEMTKGPKNNRQAYLDAGGKCKDPGSQDAQASRMLRIPKIRKFLNLINETAASEAVMSKAEALERLTRTAKVTIRDVCDFSLAQVGEDENGAPVYQTVWTIKNSRDIPDHIAACIKSVSMTQNGPKLELYDSHGAIKQLSDMMGWNAPRKSEVTGRDGKALAVQTDVSNSDIAKALTELMGKL